MARVALIFLFAFCVFHLSAGARIVRDADEAEKKIQELGKGLTEFFQNTFTKENMEKFQANMKEIGEKLAEQSKTLMNQANEGIQKLKEKEQVPV